MPTGYTADVCDGKVTEFKDFALKCARAFGALVMMRDEAMDAPIPDEFLAETSYNEQALARDQMELTRLLTMSVAEVEAAAEAEFQAGLEASIEANRQYAETDARIHGMMDKVRAWKPPSKDHTEMKSFMLEQLRISLTDYRSKPPPKTVRSALV